MASYTTYNFPDYFKGNTFRARTVTLTINGAAKNLTGSAIKIQFRAGNEQGEVIKELSIGSGLTLTYPTLGKFQIDKFTITLPVGTYYYDIRYTFVDGEIKTYQKGTMKIMQNTTE